MDRRTFGTLMVSTLAGMTFIRPASAKNPARDLETRLQEFKAFPGTTSFRIDIGRDEVASDSAADQLFVASAIKTFILCQYLRDVEAGRLSEDEQLPVNDSVRHSDSVVLLDLTGTTPARSILEAMITHSDNTATDIALLRVGPNRVRSFIAAARLGATLIPDSTRRFFSLTGCEFQIPQNARRLINVEASTCMPECRCWRRSQRSTSRWHWSSPAQGRATRLRHA